MKYPTLLLALAVSLSGCVIGPPRGDDLYGGGDGFGHHDHDRGGGDHGDRGGQGRDGQGGGGNNGGYTNGGFQR
ncbi:hypothetical protein [Glaciimonas sp. PCH181]|uniref:hypothetical protein n=1 Tax=Glaciimonas sp. PCH181 TaxID=2133943 RepID=UPI0011B20CB0|nr:hypothetical protein [Glaciimonas sp. PCH181]